MQKREGIVRAALENVQRFSLDCEIIQGKRGFLPRVVEIGNQRVKIGDAAMPGTFECELREGRWEVRRLGAEDRSESSRPYRAGAAANLYQGEPLLLVYGTGSRDARRRGQLLQLARKLSRYVGPHHAAIRSSFPVVADTELTAEQ